MLSGGSHIVILIEVFYGYGFLAGKPKNARTTSPKKEPEALARIDHVSNMRSIKDEARRIQY